MSDTKMIRIVSRGYVFTSRGRVLSPIMCPYRESVNRIWSMITVDRADVEEKLDDGSFVPLTVQNYDKDNNIKADVATGVPVKVTKEPETVIKTDETIKSDEQEVVSDDTNLSNAPETVEEHQDEVPADNSGEEAEDLENSEESDVENEDSVDDSEDESTNQNQNFSNNRNKKKRNRNRNHNQNVEKPDLGVPVETVE